MGNSKRNKKVSINFERRYNSSIRRIWPWPSVLLEEVTDLLTALPGTLWLDAACGEGQLSDLIGKQKKLFGIDIDIERALLAKSRTYQKVILGSVTSIPFADMSLSGVVSIETLEHVDALTAALAEVRRCLCPYGYFLVSMPSVTLRSLSEMHRLRKPVYCDTNEHVRELSSISINKWPNRFQTWSWLEKQFLQYGFKKIHAWGIGYVFPMWTGKLSWLEHIMNIFYREKINKFFKNIPLISKFPYYRIYLLQKGR